MRRWAIAIAAVLAAILVGVGLLGSDERPAATGESAFAEALDGVRGAERIGAGFGWVDIDALRAEPGRDAEALAWASRALGPGGDDLLDEDRGALTRLGLDPLQASEVVSVAGSFSFGVRFDELDPDAFARRVRAEATGRDTGGGWTDYDLTDPGSIPAGPVGDAAGALGGRVGIGPHGVVLARSDQGRDDLTRPSDRGTLNPLASFAADCLGDVVTARVVPNNFNHIPNFGPDLSAFGVRAASNGAGHEVVCAIEPSSKSVAGYADAMAERLAPEAVEPTTGEPIGDLISAARIDALEGDAYEAARAELTIRPGVEPGTVFRAYNRGGLITYFGLQEPGTGTATP